MYNILKDDDMKTMVDYVSNFSVEERTLIAKMFERVKEQGYEKTKALINQELVSGNLG
jgi:hypothetical protein